MEVKKSNVKLNVLLDIEKTIQTKWESDKIFEENAPDAKSYLKLIYFQIRLLET